MTPVPAKQSELQLSVSCECVHRGEARSRKDRLLSNLSDLSAMSMPRSVVAAAVGVGVLLLVVVVQGSILAKLHFGRKLFV
jgi:hypothetical protein